MSQKNRHMVERLQQEGVLKTPVIIEALLTVDRKDFVRQKDREWCYDDVSLSIGYGQTISQPYTVAFMLELLQPQAGDDILDIGSGSGYTTVLLARISKTGKVIGIECVPWLVSFGRKNMETYEYLNVDIKKNGARLGIPGELFDKILVSASARTLPEELIDQLKIGGRMVIPIGDTIYSVVKHQDGGIETKGYPGFAFVPLIH